MNTKTNLKTALRLSDERREALGAHLRTIRESTDMSQEYIAESMGYTTSQYVSNIERGVSPVPMEYIKKLHDIAGVDLKDTRAVLYRLYTEQIKELLS